MSFPRRRWFDRPFDRLTVLSVVEGLTTLSKVEGESRNRLLDRNGMPVPVCTGTGYGRARQRKLPDCSTVLDTIPGPSRGFVFELSAMSYELFKLHLLEKMGVGPTDGERFRIILELDKQPAAKRSVNTGNAAKIDNGAAVDPPELIRVQFLG